MNYTDSGCMKNAFESCKPSVRRHWLVFAAGVVWLTVGCGLTSAACFWLYSSQWPLSLVLGALSLALGLIVYSFGFSRIVSKNLERISDLSTNIAEDVIFQAKAQDVKHHHMEDPI